MATFKGTNKAETLRGSSLADKIQAMGGDDLIYGFAGNDKAMAAFKADYVKQYFEE